MKNSSDTIGNRPRDLPTCSAVPQPTALPRVPNTYMYLTYYVHLAGIKEVTDCQNSRSGKLLKKKSPQFCVKISSQNSHVVPRNVILYLPHFLIETVRISTCLVSWCTRIQNNDTKPATSALHVTSCY